MRSRPGRAVTIALAAAIALVPAPASAAETRPPSAGTAVLAVWTGSPEANLVVRREADEPADGLLRSLEAVPGFAVGLLSSSQGRYDQRQALLDISQGSRQPTSLYSPREAPELRMEAFGTGAVLRGWAPVRGRARRVSTTLRPGLLAASIPGGAAFVGVDGRQADPAIAAADASGRVAASSVGPASTVSARVLEVLEDRRFAVVALPEGPEGRQALDALIRERPRETLLLVAHLPPTPVDGAVSVAPRRFYALPAVGAAGSGKSGSLTSGTTRHGGLVSTIDVAPTVLDHLGLEMPQSMRGEVMSVGAQRSAAHLEMLRRRWSDVRGARQWASLEMVLVLSLLLLLLLGSVHGLARSLRPCLRAASLAVMWWPTMALSAALFSPRTRTFEALLIAGASLVAGLATDAALRWPRGPMAPAGVGIVAYGVDLATGGEVLVRSVLGPSILSGGRFYGISNELEPLLPILALVGLAAYVSTRSASARLGAVYAAAGVALGAVVGSGRLGADVGGVVTVAGGFTLATLVVARRRVTVRSVGLIAAISVLALVALVALDLGLGGDAHLSRNLTRSNGVRDVVELVTRRYQLSVRVLSNPSTALSLVAAVLAVCFGARNRKVLYSTIGDPAWSAVLAGGLASGVLGALTNDSGPVLLVNSVVALGSVTMYAQGARPAPERSPAPGAL